MLIDFADDDLKRLYVDAMFRLPALGSELTKAFRKVVGFAARASDERDLRSMRSLHFEKLQGQRAGQHSLRLNNQWRLIVRFEERTQGKTIVVLGVDDYH